MIFKLQKNIEELTLSLPVYHCRQWRIYIRVSGSERVNARFTYYSLADSRRQNLTQVYAGVVTILYKRLQTKHECRYNHRWEVARFIKFNTPRLTGVAPHIHSFYKAATPSPPYVLHQLPHFFHLVLYRNSWSYNIYHHTIMYAVYYIV